MSAICSDSLPLNIRSPLVEFRIVLRGALAGVIAGIIGFVFARIFAEPVINQAIDYESGRDEILGKLNEAAGGMARDGRPEIFSRTVQSTVGIATGVIAFSAAMVPWSRWPTSHCTDACASVRGIWSG